MSPKEALKVDKVAPKVDKVAPKVDLLRVKAKGHPKEVGHQIWLLLPNNFV